MKINFRILVLLSAVLFVQNNNQAYSTDLGGNPKIVSSINPIYQIVNFITGDDKNDTLLINPRVSEHDYQFKPSDVSKVSNADVVFYIDDSLETGIAEIIAKAKNYPKAVPLMKNKNLNLLSFQMRFGENITDPHIWLSPANAIIMAGQIADVLSQISPKNAATYKKNLEDFTVQVNDMNLKNRLALTKVRQKSFIVYHNSTSYFEDYYQLKAAGVMTYYHNQELTLDDIKRINNLIKSSSVSCILGTPQDQNGFAMQAAMSNKVKFVLADILGGQTNYKQNGYVKLMSDFVNELVKCTN